MPVHEKFGGVGSVRELDCYILAEFLPQTEKNKFRNQ